LKAHKIL